MNHYACYALKSEAGYAFSDAIEQCSFQGGTQFSFGMDFYYTEKEGVLFSQNENVICRIANKQLEWRAAGWCLATSSFTMPLIEQSWNHMDVVYGEKQAILYLNAVEAQRVDIKAEPVYGKEEYHYMEQDMGYLRNVRIVDHAMTQEEIIHNLMQTVIEKEHLRLFIPFDVPFCQDRGIFEKVVHYGGLSRCESIVKALCFNGEGYALLDGAETNPGSSEMADFSVAVRIFALPYSVADSILFENTGEADVFQICLTGGQKKVTLTFGTEKFMLEGSMVQPYTWTDIIVSRKGADVQCFINGQSAGSVKLAGGYLRSSSPRLVLGNKFKGYLDYVGIYGKALNEEESLAVHQTEPYVFDEELKFLFLFHGEKEENLLGRGTLLLHKNAEIAMTEGTVSEEVIEPFHFRTKSGFSGNDFEKWQADFLADVVTQFSSQAVGMEPLVLDEGAKEYLWSQTVMQPEAQELFLDFAAFTTAEIINFMSMAALQRGVLQVALASMMKGAFSAFIIANVDKILAFQLGLGITIGILFITDAAIRTKEKTKEPSEPPAPPTPPEPKKGYAIELLSLQFCNGQEGSILLRENWQTQQSLPEWDAALAKTGTCAYIRGQQTPNVKICFRYIPAKDQPPVLIKIGIRNQLLGEGISDEVYCTSNRIYETEAVFQANRLSGASMGKYQDNFSCFYQAEGRKTMLRTADMNIHVLCRIPQLPWSIKEPEKAPMLPMLEQAAKMFPVELKVTEEVGFIEAAASWFFRQTLYTLETSPRYSRQTLTGIEFCCVKFLERLAVGTLSAGELDYYMFLADMAAMEGLNLTVYEIFSMEKGVHNWKGELSVIAPGIDRKEGSTIFGRPCPAGVRYGYVISDKASQAASYWDILLLPKGGSSGLKNMTWKAYCEQALAEGAFVYEPAPLLNWKEVCELPKRSLKITFNTEEELFVPDGRWDFKPYVKELHSYPQNKACCHRISYDTSERILITAFNKLKQEEIRKEEKDKILKLLMESFYPFGRPNRDIWGADTDNYDELKKIIEKLKRVTAEQLKGERQCINVGKILDEALRCLNSALPNLRAGYSSWNSSIGEGYDFSNWVCVIDGYEVISEKGLLNPPISTDKNQGIYLLSETDGRNIHMLRTAEQILQEEFLEMQFGVYLKWEDREFVYYPVIYSSLNEFPLAKVRGKMIVLPYYYINPDTKEWTEIWE